ncbi:MAG: TOTE conflict system archaeo-eukaryotic primase domain-containing protein, partial [Candidatus Ornithospirochaeta sp.]
MKQDDSSPISIDVLEDDERPIEIQLKETDEEITRIKEILDKLKQKKNELLSKMTPDDGIPEISLLSPSLSKKNSPEEKAELMLSLFSGRQDVFATRNWNNKKDVIQYYPKCSNFWMHDCQKRINKDRNIIPTGNVCSNCQVKQYIPLTTDEIIQRQFRNNKPRGEEAIGIYPMRPGDNTRFLAIDFDDSKWDRDALLVAGEARKIGISAAVEKSYSGNGAHVWIFFSEEVPAYKARRLAINLLDTACRKSGIVKFESYDRIFPSQDHIGKEGMGNLILMPLVAGAATRDVNPGTVFVNNNLEKYSDQIEFISSLPRYDNNDVDSAIARLEKNDSVLLPIGEDDLDVKWLKRLPPLTSTDVKRAMLKVYLSAGISFDKSSVSPRFLDGMRRLALIPNPQYFIQRQTNGGIPPRNVSSFVRGYLESDRILQIPRGLKNEVEKYLERSGIKFSYEDHRPSSTGLSARFNGELREEQKRALSSLLSHDSGILEAAPSFGKTVVAAALIAERKEKTLILVTKKDLLKQWKEKLEKLLEIENIPEKRNGKRKSKSPIGILGGGKDSLTGLVDIATFQSVASKNLDIMRSYGMVIADECHHVASENFLSAMRILRPRYVYGLTATTKRDDGLEKLVFLHIGPVVFKFSPDKLAYGRGIAQYVIPRFTNVRVTSPGTRNFTKSIRELSENKERNSLIASDIVSLFKKGKKILVLTQFLSHLEALKEELERRNLPVIALSGSKKGKDIDEAFAKVRENSSGEMVVVATSKYLGEGTDIP